MTELANESLIREMENDRYAAMLAGDVAALDTLCADELIYTHSNGDRDTKASYLEKVESKYFIYHWIDHPIEHLYVGPGYAIVAGQMRAHVTNSGEERQLDNSCLAVWVNTSGEWKFAAYQPTPNKR